MKEIGIRFNISYWTVLDRLDKAGVKKLTRHPLDEKSFTVFCDNSCYWAGFIAADGWINKYKYFVGVELKDTDYKHLEKLCAFVKRDKKLWYVNHNLNGKIFRHASLSLNSKKLVLDLENNFNIVPAKSLILTPPLNVPKYLRKHFIRGYFDGDGSIGWHKFDKKARFQICSGSRDIIAWIYSVIKEENVFAGNPSILQRGEINYYSFEFKDNNTMAIFDWLYSDSTTETRLDRKYERYLNYCK